MESLSTPFFFSHLLLLLRCSRQMKRLHINTKLLGSGRPFGRGRCLSEFIAVTLGIAAAPTPLKRRSHIHGLSVSLLLGENEKNVEKFFLPPRYFMGI